MKGNSCTVVPIGEDTTLCKWINYEIYEIKE
ncbi:TIR domain-containing protein [Peribacillus frigoritolerans]